MRPGHRWVGVSGVSDALLWGGGSCAWEVGVANHLWVGVVYMFGVAEGFGCVCVGGGVPGAIGFEERRGQDM